MGFNMPKSKCNQMHVRAFWFKQIPGGDTPGPPIRREGERKGRGPQTKSAPRTHKSHATPLKYSDATTCCYLHTKMNYNSPEFVFMYIGGDAMHYVKA